MALVIASANVASGFSRTQWFMATSETAVAISDDSSAAARVLAALTMARAVMQQVAAVEPLPPVRAFAVKNEAMLRELMPQYWERRGVRPHGASYTGPHAAFIAVRTDIPIPQQFPLLLHEYVHLLTAAHVPQAPAWLDEGLSEFWGALVLDGQRIVIGRPPARHLNLLRTRTWLPLDDMRQHQRGKLAADQARASMFYAQSWAIVHYLLLGRGSTSPLTFAPSEQQWTPQLDAAVRVYVTGGQFREVSIQSSHDVNVASGFLGADSSAVASAKVEALAKAASRTQPQPISEARSLAERANMLVFGERPDAALPLVRRALSLDSREPLALEVMGTHYFLRNQPDQARAWLSQALDADHDRYSSALYLALLSSSPSDRERYLQAAVRAKPDLTVAWQRLWTLYDEDGRGEHARRWCDRLTVLLRPWLWVDQPLRCDGQVRR
ncbi:MAG: hypothetical protein WC815_09395 [Vicinamibacterales bacterium]